MVLKWLRKLSLKALRSVFLFSLIPLICYAQVTNPPLEVTEEDSVPSTYPYRLKFPNGSVTDNGDSTTSIDFTGGSLPTTYLKLDQSTPQTLTASPIFDWGTATRVPYYSATKTLTDSLNFTYVDTGSGALSLNAGTFSTSGQCNTGNIVATVPPTITVGLSVLADASHPITATSYRTINASVDYNPSSNSTEATGTFRLLELKGSKDITNVYGDYASISSAGSQGNTGTRTNTYCYYAGILNSKGTDSAIAALFYGANFQPWGTPTNCYGLRLPNISGGTNNYAIQTGTGNVVFGDDVSATYYASTVAIGTSPYSCTSTTLNTNLNADLWDGYQFSDYLDQAVKTTSSPTFVGLTLSGMNVAGFVKNSAAGVLSGGNTISVSDITDISTNYLKLDQTTPQTTVGTFTFPTVNFGATTGVSATASAGVLTLTGLSGNAENLTLDFATDSNQIDINTGTGVTNIQCYIPQFTVQRNAIGSPASATAGFKAENITAATSGAKDQDSPALNLAGTYWDGAASQIGQWWILSKSINAGLRHDLYFYYKLGAGAVTRHAFVLGGDNTAQWSTATALNETIKAGFQNINAANSTVLLDQYSPDYFLWGDVWSTSAGAHKAVKAGTLLAPEQGANGIGVYKLIYNTNGGAALVITNESFRCEWGDNFAIGLLGETTPANNTVQINGDALIADRATVGNEKITNGTTFASGWTADAGAWHIVSNAARKDTSGVTTLSQTSAAMVTPLVVGETYLLSFDVTNNTVTDGSMVVTCGGQTMRNTTTNNGTYTWTFTATSTASLVFTPSIAASRFYIDNVSLKKINGGDLLINGTLRVNGNVDPYAIYSNVLTDRTGFGTSAPDRKVEINDTSGNCLRLTYNDSDGTAANYADLLVASNGNLTIQPTGTTPYLLANKQVYGDMYANEQSQSVTVSLANTYYKIAGSMSGGTCNGFTFQNSDELKCLVAGTYLVTWSLSVNCATNSQDLSGAVMINTTAQLNTTNHNFNGTGASKNASISGTGIITLAVNDVVGLSVANHTAANNIIMEHANLTLLRVDA